MRQLREHFVGKTPTGHRIHKSRQKYRPTAMPELIETVCGWHIWRIQGPDDYSELCRTCWRSEAWEALRRDYSTGGMHFGITGDPFNTETKGKQVG